MRYGEYIMPYFFECRCEWKGTKCKPEDFTPTFTDFGKCYTFNAGKNNDSNYMTSRIGINILDKVLNIGLQFLASGSFDFT